jgi:uncharacterized iron-regulated membrane protein
MSKSLLLNFRLLHRKIASVLFIFFFIIALTGILLGWKSIFTKAVFEDKQKIAAIDLKDILAIDSLENIATTCVNEKTNNSFKNADRIEIRPAKGIAVAYYKKNYNIQLNAITGKPLLIEQKNGGLFQDIHDGAIVGDLFNSKAGGTTKTIYSTIMGLALLLLTLTGFYMWYKPKQIKNNKNA